MLILKFIRDFIFKKIICYKRTFEIWFSFAFKSSIFRLHPPKPQCDLRLRLQREPQTDRLLPEPGHLPRPRPLQPRCAIQDIRCLRAKSWRKRRGILWTFLFFVFKFIKFLFKVFFFRVAPVAGARMSRPSAPAPSKPSSGPAKPARYHQHILHWIRRLKKCSAHYKISPAKFQIYILLLL